MSDVPYVNEEAVLRAQELEKKFLKLPPESGVLFISVRPIPTPGGRTKEFDVRLGISRRYEEGTGMAIIKKVLEDDLKGGLDISAAVYRGVRGAGSDEDPQGPHPLAS